MGLPKNEVISILKSSGVGEDYRKQSAKFSDYPLAMEIKNAIKSGEIPSRKGIFFVSPNDYKITDTMHMIARYMAYPCRRSVYVGSNLAFYDMLRWSENPRICKPADEEGFCNARHVFLTDFFKSNEEVGRYGLSTEGAEQFIMDARKDGRIFHLHSKVYMEDITSFSYEFQDFLLNNYVQYKHFIEGKPY